MRERHDPAHAGVKAGRIVGVLTVILLVVSLLRIQETFVGRLETVVELVGIDPGASITVYFYLYTAGAAITRYGICYIVGSLLGVVYDWLDTPSIGVLAGLVLAVGLVDGTLAALDTGHTVTGLGYVLAWLCYLPAFVWFNDDKEPTRDGPLRLGDQ
jgi:hypothetical protein